MHHLSPYFSLLSPGLLAAKTHHPYQVLCIQGPEQTPTPIPIPLLPLLLMSHLFIFVHTCLPSNSPRARVTSRPSVVLPPFKQLNPQIPLPPLCHWWELFPTCSFTVYKQKRNKKIVCICIYTCLSNYK